MEAVVRAHPKRYQTSNCQLRIRNTVVGAAVPSTQRPPHNLVVMMTRTGIHHDFALVAHTGLQSTSWPNAGAKLILERQWLASVCPPQLLVMFSAERPAVFRTWRRTVACIHIHRGEIDLVFECKLCRNYVPALGKGSRPPLQVVRRSFSTLPQKVRSNNYSS